MVAETRARVRRGRHPGQQCRHPARRERSRISRTSDGTRSSRSTCRRAFHAIEGRIAADEAREAGAASSTSPRRTAWSPVGEKAAYVAAKHGARRPDQGRPRSRRANQGITCNAICPGWVLTPLVQQQIEARAKRAGHRGRKGARGSAARKAADARVHDPRDRSARWRCSCAATPPRRSPAPPCRSTAAGSRSSGSSGGSPAALVVAAVRSPMRRAASSPLPRSSAIDERSASHSWRDRSVRRQFVSYGRNIFARNLTANSGLESGPFASSTDEYPDKLAVLGAFQTCAPPPNRLLP